MGNTWFCYTHTKKFNIFCAIRSFLLCFSVKRNHLFPVIVLCTMFLHKPSSKLIKFLHLTIQRKKYDSEIIRKTANAPYYVSNITLHNDLEVPFVRDLVTTRYNKFNSSLSHHTNPIPSLAPSTLPQNPCRRSRGCWLWRDHIVQWIKDIKGVFPMANFSTNTQTNVLIHILPVAYIYIWDCKKKYNKKNKKNYLQNHFHKRRGM
jgi:hypothetical protein